MTRAEEAALKAYPELLSGSIFGPLPVDINKACREKYQEGYEQAEKDINKELMDIMADIREKQEKVMYADYDIHIDTSNASDTSVAYIFKGDKVIDLLTWEDMQRIVEIYYTLHDSYKGNSNIYNEVLRRFNKSKEEKK